jgi:predicted ester cyclase
VSTTFEVEPRRPFTRLSTNRAVEVVNWFLAHVRVTGDPVAAAQIMAPLVRCHQVSSDAPQTIVRTPSEYAAHVQDMLAAFGRFRYTVTELLADGDRVYVRWQQDGHLRSDPNGPVPIGTPLRDVGSAVYRVADGRIQEYWIQLDRLGLERQLTAAAELSESRSPA